MVTVCLSWFNFRFLIRQCANRPLKDHLKVTSSKAMEDNLVPSDSSKRKQDELNSDDVSNESKKIKTESSTNDVDKSPSVNRIRKPKKAVLLLCYLGKNYYGMQRNHGVQTVESELMNALLKAEIILPEELATPQLMKFQRAARTDKGVSAARQIVSLKIPIKEIADTFPDKVNQHLPPEIKVLCAKRVTQAFDAKIACDARTYSYMLPTFAFSDSESEVNELYRISDDRLKDVNNFLKTYVGTHNFYNFTSGRLASDASCKRFIISCECGQPFTKDGLEFVVIKIKGQSFMLHQIRKMIGLAIAVIRKLVPVDDILQKIWKMDRVDIPMAPSIGLMLEEVHYDWYNKKYGGDGLHEPLQWDSYQDIINKFREEHILATMVLAERNEKSISCRCPSTKIDFSEFLMNTKYCHFMLLMASAYIKGFMLEDPVMLQWLQTLPYHTYDVREPKAPEPKAANEEETESTLSPDTTAAAAVPSNQ